MAASNRKPSSSSSRSDHPSPLQSPGNHSHRNLTPTGHLFGSAGSKNAGSGWQTWGGTSPSTRQIPGSDATQIPLRDSSWQASRGAWESNSHQADSHLSVNQRNTRQRQASAHAHTATMEDSATVFPQISPYLPQRLDAVGTKGDATASRLSTSPTRHGFGATSPFSTQQPMLPNTSMGAYDSSQVSGVVEGELSVAMRGMAVEHEHGLSQHPGSTPQVSLSDPTRSAARGPTQAQPQRPSYPAFPQPEYPAYYSAPSRVDYPYPFDAYGTSETMYGSPALSAASPALYSGMPAPAIPPAPDMRNSQSAAFYDYASSGRPLSQFYYPQPMLYPAPPHNPGPASGGHNKRRSIQIPFQTSVMYSSVRTSPSARPQSYHAGLAMPAPGIFMHDAMQYGAPMQMHAQHGGGRGRRQEDANVAFRSPLLEEFRNSKDRKWTLKDIYGHVAEFSTDQHGSRFIQQKIETADEEEMQMIFDEIMPKHAIELIQDVFGNYVIQKFLEHGNSAQKLLLASAMEGHILALSLQMYGCRVVQKAIEYVPPEQQGVFVSELTDHVLRCVKDANGNHVIQRLIESVPSERLTFISAFQGHVNDLATHPYGCRVLQRCFENLPEHQTRVLLSELQEHALLLGQDQFGNYVIQFVLEHGHPDDRAKIVARLRGQMLHMSRHKFASNVVEKALVTADASSRRALIEEILTPRPDGSSPVVAMMRDQFANYVLQRALIVADQDQKEALVELIKPQLAAMRKSSHHHGRHLVAIERLVQKCTVAAARETPALADAAAIAEPASPSSVA